MENNHSEIKVYRYAMINTHLEIFEDGIVDKKYSAVSYFEDANHDEAEKLYLGILGKEMISALEDANNPNQEMTNLKIEFVHTRDNDMKISYADGSKKRKNPKYIRTEFHFEFHEIYKIGNVEDYA